MLVTFTTTHPPATDLGFLLHKNPQRAYEAPLPFGNARVVYPEASEQRCTAALIVDVDPIGLARRRRGDPSLEQYVNDRPYAASSFLSSAIGRVLGTALSGRSKERPELAATALPLEARLPVLPCRGGEPVLRRLFEPLGYAVVAEAIPLDGQFPEWGASQFLDVRIRHTIRLQELLQHLYVLLPVLDDDKHYWVDNAEIDKLLRQGGDWLARHPEKDLIAARYLRHNRRLADAALTRLLDDDNGEPDEVHDAEEEAVEKPISLNTQRIDAVIAAVRATTPRTVVDLGCGAGQLVRRLLADTDATVLGIDVSHRALETAAHRLHLDDLSPRGRERVRLEQGALTYRDARLAGFDVATLVEVIEHLDPSRLAAFERVVFGYARPATVVLTTPNREYNVLFPTLPAGELRHADHRFEWSRAELAGWAGHVADRFGYRVEVSGIGPRDETHGQPTQLAVFSRVAAA